VTNRIFSLRLIASRIDTLWMLTIPKTVST
jgi:hypothetical protein